MPANLLFTSGASSIYILILLTCSDPGKGEFEFLGILVSSAPPISAEAIAPVFSVALEDMALKYPQIFRRKNSSLSVYNYVGIEPAVDPCFPGASGPVIERISELYAAGSVAPRRNSTQIILTAACTLPFAVIGDFAREEDILTLSCGPAEFERKDFVRFPTAMVTYPGSAVLMGLSLTVLAEMFKWRKIAFMVDTVGVRVTNNMQSLIGAFESRKADFNTLTVTFNSGKSNNYEVPLAVAGAHSGIIVIMTLDGFIRKILADAVRLGMTEGRYLFIYFYNIQVPFEPPIMWRYHHKEDNISQEVLDAMECVLVLRFVAFDFEAWRRQTEKISRRRTQMFQTVPSVQMDLHETALGCYESVEILAQVLNESVTASGSSNLARYVAGRTFALSHRNVSFTSDGRRVPEFVLQQFDVNITDFKDVARFNVLNISWQFLGSRSFHWKGGHIPRDTFLDDAFFLSNRPTFIGVIGLLALTILTVVIAGVFRYYVRKQAEDNSPWWRLETAWITFISRMKSTKTLFSLAGIPVNLK